MSVEQLSDEVTAVLATLRLDEDGVRFSEADFAKHKSRFEAAAPERRKELCKELLAAALKVMREGDAARPALEQITELCAILLVNRELAEAVVASVTGADVSKRPVGTERVEGAVSPLGARFGAFEKK